ncbi:Protein SERAC1, partial [Lachnellula suecica]
MACTKETVKPSGLNIWSSEAVDGPAPAVDIIAVQGLGSHEFYTWVKKVPSAETDRSKTFKDRAQFWKVRKQQGKDDSGNDGPAECMWIRDCLVPMFKDARIATYSYKSDWRDPDVKTNLRECANLFLNELLHYRQQENERQRPIVLIGHSLGCVVIQQALFSAASSRYFHDLGLSVAGIIFLGAPLRGSDAARWGTWLAQALHYDSTILKLLQKDSQPLFDIGRDFSDCRIDWDLVCFYEKQDAKFGPFTVQIVKQQSASRLGKRMIPLDTNHCGLNKFSGEHDENFALVLPEIRRIVTHGPSIVAERFRAKDNIPTRLGNVHWIVPRSTNTLFTGRDKLLLRIQKAIHCDPTSPPDKQKRFVITGMGGQGKSEICLKVASQMQKEFWGVFWVDVNKEATVESEFIAIVKRLGYSAESVPKALEILASSKQTWLLILDNADNPNFDYQVYFPSGTNGAVMITSRVAECKRYSPDANEALEGLQEEESKELLRKAAGIPQE